MSQANELPDVRVGQLWKDNDKRADRTLTVVRLLDDGKVLCTIGATGKQTRIRRDRFRPTASGYRLLRDNGRKASEVPHE